MDTADWKNYITPEIKNSVVREYEAMVLVKGKKAVFRKPRILNR